MPITMPEIDERGRNRVLVPAVAVATVVVVVVVVAVAVVAVVAVVVGRLEPGGCWLAMGWMRSADGLAPGKETERRWCG